MHVVEAATLLGILLVVAVTFRSWAAPAVTLVAVGAAVVVTLGVAGTLADLLNISVPADLRPLIVALLLGVESPSGSLPDTLHDLGLVLVLLAYVAVVLLTTSRSTAVQRLLVPLRAIGTLALSVYVQQVALVAALARAGLGYSADTPLAALALVLGLCTAAVLWWRFLGAGPVERLTARLTGLVPR